MNSYRRLIVTGIAALVAAVSVAQVAAAAPSAPEVPGDIQVEDGHKVFLVAHAVGVQIYPCNATAAGFSWGGSTPRATLYDDKGKAVGEHFGGPTWRYQDGSSVVAARVNGVIVDPTAIPWLLLKANSRTVGADGDRLANTTFIQRVATTGGVAPAAADCTATSAGSRVEVPYTADYHFWKATGSAG
jgi:Protein of unknown function (DUF3455)